MSRTRIAASLAPAAVLAAAALAGCQTAEFSPAYPTAAPPPAPVAQPPSPAAIVGHGAFRLPSGARASCAGLSVALEPDTPPYHRRVMELYKTTNWSMEPTTEIKARSAKLPPSPETALTDAVSCDVHGSFSFANQQPGSYFLIGHVKTKPAENGHDDFLIVMMVGLRPGETQVVSLAP